MTLAIVGTPNGGGPVAASSLTFAHDAGSGDRRWIFVKVGVFSAGEQPTVTGVTYNGAALALVAAALESYAAGANIVREETWAAVTSATGSNNVVVSLSGAADSLTAVAVTFADCGGAGSNTDDINGNISSIAMALTSQASTSLLLGGWRGGAVRGITTGTGVTETAFVDDGSNPPNNKLQWAGVKAASGGADTWAVTLNTATRSAGTLVEVLEDLGDGGGPDYTLALDAGSYTLTGNAANVLASRLLALDAGTYAITGNDAGLLVGRLLALDAGAYAVTGNDVSALVSRLLALDAGSYSLSGHDAGLLVSRLIGFDAGSYALTGLDVGLQYNQLGGPDYTLALDSGSYTLSGGAVGLTVRRKLALDSGSYATAGNNVDLLARRLLAMDAGAYTLSGNDAALVVSRLLELDPGSYTLAGFAVTLDYSGEVLGAIVELSDAATYDVGLSDAAAYAVVVRDGALYVVEIGDELI